jgi:hypothetical protein
MAAPGVVPPAAVIQSGAVVVTGWAIGTSGRGR